MIYLYFSGDVAVEVSKEGVMCMNQYKKMFSTCRVPGLIQDTLLTNFESNATHIIVLLKNQVYKVNVLHPSMKRPTNSELER